MVWISDLPLHIREQIFCNLSQWDRFNVRLVCKDWYNSSWSFKLCHNESICIRGMKHICPASASSPTALETFVDGSHKKKLYNVKFQYYKMMVSEKEKRFWSRFGSSIRQLSFTCCKINTAALLFILEKCSHLETVQFNGQLYTGEVYLPSEIPSTELLRNNLTSLKSLQFLSDNLTFLSLGTFSSNLTTLDDLYYQIQIKAKPQRPENEFPNMADLKAFLNNVHVKSVVLRLEMLCSEEVSNNKMKEILSTGNLPLKELTISLNQNVLNTDICQVFQEVSCHHNTLTSLSLEFRGFSASLNSQQFGRFLDCISLLSNLKTFRLNCKDWNDNGGGPRQIAKIIWVALESLTSLRHLCIQAPSDSDGDGEDGGVLEQLEMPFPARFGRSLKELDVWYSYLGSYLLRAESTIVFKTLTSITLDSCCGVSNETLQFVCKACTGLKNFTVHVLHEKENESTGNKMIYSNVTDSAWTGQTDLHPWISVTAPEEGAEDMSDLKNLEQLSLWGVFGDPTVLRLRFTRLRSLELLIADINDVSLLSIAENNPNLESIKIGTYGNCSPSSTGHPYFPQLTWPGVQHFLEAATKLEQFSLKPQCSEFDHVRIHHMIRARPSLQKINGHSTWKSFITAHT